MQKFILTRQGQEAFVIAKELTTDRQLTAIPTELLVLAMARVNDAGAGQAMLHQHINRNDIEKELANASHVQKHPHEDVSLHYADSWSNSIDQFEKQIRGTTVELVAEPGVNQVAVADRRYFVSDWTLAGLYYAQSMVDQRGDQDGGAQTQDLLVGIVDRQETNAFWLLLKLLLIKMHGFNGEPYTNIVQSKLDFLVENDGENIANRRLQQRRANSLGNKLARADYSLLAEYGRDLTKLAAENRLAPVTGRDKEIQHLALVLNRRQKSNVILVGPAGAGKTAVAEGLAIQMAAGKLPSLAGKRLIALDPEKFSELMVSGWSTEVVAHLIAELRAHRDWILFLDEIQNLRFHNYSNTMDMLKPALARGDLQMVGATTPAEARLFFNGDDALMRRFEVVNVKPLNAKQAAIVVRKAIIPYENYYQVNYSPAARQLAIDLARTYLASPLPDSALTIIDNAGALVRMRAGRRAANDSYIRQRQTLEKQLQDAKAKSLNEKRVAQLRDQLAKLEGKFDQEQNNGQRARYSTSVSTTDVVKATEAIIGRQLSKAELAKAKKERETQSASLLGLGARLKQHVVGQDEAIDGLVQSLIVAQAGLRKPGAPVGSFFFAGTTGTGKTATAKQLAIEQYGTEKALLRFNMTDYLGENGPAVFATSLYQRVMDRPDACILLDEIEKGQPALFNLLLGVMDDGSLLPGVAAPADFSHTIIIMTSNIGASQLYRNQVGFGAASPQGQYRVNRDIVFRAIKERFAPEFVNRLTKTVVFNPLDTADLLTITNLMLEGKRRLLDEKDIGLTWDQRLTSYVVKHYADPAYGARPLQRGIDQLITSRIAQLILQGQLKAHQTIHLSIDHEQLLTEVA